MVQAVSSQNNNTIVVINSVGPLILEPWIDHPNVTAVVWAGLGGTETGNALVDVIYGAANPSGRLPYTIAKSPRDYPAQLVLGGNGEEILNITYSEGCVFCVPFILRLLSEILTVTTSLFRSLFVDYRHFDAEKITPRFEFGFGLSYTLFQYSGLVITPVEEDQDQDGQLEANWLAGQPGPQGVGSSTTLWLHRAAYTVSFTVANTGQVAGTEVRILSFSSPVSSDSSCEKKICQVYLHFPVGAGEPPSVLRGFADVELQPGESRMVSVTLSRYDLSVWDVPSQSWMRALGTYSLSVGASSRDFRLNGVLPL